jgi:hypothetical protein
MARAPDALEFRKWALGYSPSVLQRRAMRQWESVASDFGKRVSPFLLERWRAGVFGEETDQERQQYDNEFMKGILEGTLIEESLFVASWEEKLSESLGVPVVCDRAPYEVPMGYAHMFDIRSSEIRRNTEAAMSESELVEIRAAIEMMREESPPNLYAALSSMRPIMDRTIPILIRSSDGFGIHTEFVRHWIVFNVRSARYAVDARHKQAAYQSIVKINSA